MEKEHLLNSRQKMVIGLYIGEIITCKKLIKNLCKLKNAHGEKLFIVYGQNCNTLEDIRSKLESENLICSVANTNRKRSIKRLLKYANNLETSAQFFDLELNPDYNRISSWIEKMANPMLKNYDFALGFFNYNILLKGIDSFFISPFFFSLYGIKLKEPLSGVFSINQNMIKDIIIETDHQKFDSYGNGIFVWLLNYVIKHKMNISEVYLKTNKPHFYDLKQNDLALQNIKTLFECVKEDVESNFGNKIVKTPDSFGFPDSKMKVHFYTEKLIYNFTENVNSFRSVYEEVLGNDVIESLVNLSNLEINNIEQLISLWAKIFFGFLKTYIVDFKLNEDSFLKSLYKAYCRILGIIQKKVMLLTESIKDEKNKLIVIESISNNISRYITREFLNLMPEFKRYLDKIPSKTKLSITPLDYLEFIPGVPIALPKKLRGVDGRQIETGDIFKSLQKRYELQFKDFLEIIGIRDTVSSERIAHGIRSFMQDLEMVIDTLFPGNLHTKEGTLEFVNKLFKIFPHKKVNVIKREVLIKLVYEYPPRNLMIRYGYQSVSALLEDFDVRDVITFAQFTEDKDFFDKIFYWIEGNLRPESFEEVEVLPIIVDRSEFPVASGMKEISVLNRLTARIMITNLGKGIGGDYPKLRYFTLIVKAMIEAEHFSLIWKTYANDRKELGRKFVNSILGHYGKAIFSAHHIFENWHHRELAVRLKRLAKDLKSQGKIRASQRIFAMAEGYGLSLMLNDGTFMPCSAWTWASFSFKGGDFVPTPLSVKVERDWFNHDLLEEIYKQQGHDTNEIMKQIFQLISQGRESIDLANVMLGVKPYKEKVVVQELEYWPKAKKLERFAQNPILSPIKEHWWECKYVLNAATLRLEDKIYLFYRALGSDNISRIGLAITDGYRIIERLEKPIFVPEIEQEKMGCEDPRVIIIDDEILMLYTAYDGVVAQIAAASISVKDFLNREFDKWERRGLAFPGLWDKDAILFPEKIDGKYVLYHRIEPSMWIAYSDELSFPWPEDGHKIIMGPRSGFMWDSLKIGAGSQPIKTEYGWLLIYHGVDREMIYRLGVMLVELKDPGRILYRSPNPILSPEADFEIGKKSDYWVPNVVFTCGVVPAVDKEILEDDDEILVYYGAADTHICVAKGKVADLIPEEVRESIRR